jgi:hypothetical protein
MKRRAASFVILVLDVAHQRGRAHREHCTGAGGSSSSAMDRIALKTSRAATAAAMCLVTPAAGQDRTSTHLGADARSKALSGGS